MQLGQKTKKGLKIALDVILWLFLAFSLLMTVLSISATSKSGTPNIGGTYVFTVVSDSMTGTYEIGDIVIGKALSTEQKNNLQVGDIITFEDPALKAVQEHSYSSTLNTHRIVEVNKDETTGQLISVVTRGDKYKDDESRNDPERFPDQILAKCEEGKKLAGAGKVLSFLQQPTGFLLCIVLPLMLFFIYEVYVVIRTALGIKNQGKKLISASDEELIKQRAVEEYLRQQAESAAKAQNEKADEAKNPSDPSDQA